MATFNLVNSSATSFGLSLRVGGGNKGGPVCTVGYVPSSKTLTYGAWKADIIPQPTSTTVQLHVFLDRSIVET
jgi:hypothetical protein